MKVFALFVVVLFCGASSAAPADRKEAWGYVDVRKDAHMFWWLYYTDQTTNYASYPLVIWLQGGPGASSTGHGNFLEIGPLDEYLRPRNSTWLSKANLLFIDNPVGTGFSYVTNKSALATTNKQIADDLVTCLTSILDTVPEFQKSALYIFGESYGGKMTVDFALALSKAIKSKTINVNFKGIALGDPWISPIDSVFTWGPYLYATSLLDKVELQSVKAHAYEVKQTLAAGQFKNATDRLIQIQGLIANFTNGVDFFNILKKEDPLPNESVNTLPKNHRTYKFRRSVDRQHGDGDVLSDLMNGKIRQKLNDIPQNVTWGGQSSDVFKALSEDFMKPVVSSVSELLSNETYIDVNVYNGQLDLMVDTLGTLAWIEKLNWPGNKSFMAAPKKPLTFPNDHSGGFVKTFKKFSFFWILKAGHVVPSDAPESALKILDMILKKNK
ncbi:retinoid-inducible serine carboxypeptidase-like isoform X2 [Parasteatoda tepidariorum]|uniref:retinoid-inducible serine carboxypeptidase-like isoform X2 n=1 Tax=Parasteatoda tepidariorum TaxID=114398 RepID=UPI001C7258F6|nr:retinoid-inducible serine carboxypeptidase-like isoform X1 [Parasteatoda tepidariorum]